MRVCKWEESPALEFVFGHLLDSAMDVDGMVHME